MTPIHPDEDPMTVAGTVLPHLPRAEPNEGFPVPQRLIEAAQEKDNSPCPVAHLYRYVCCGEEFETTEVYDDSCHCPICDEPCEPVESIPLYAECPPAVAALRTFFNVYGHRREMTEGAFGQQARAVLAAWDATQP